MAKLIILTTVIWATLLSGCTVVSIVDTAASAAIGVTKVAVKGTVAVVDAAIPDGDDDEDEEDEEEKEKDD
ncbi:MAG: NF038104 family lipoprotein [Cellvibrionaceae bacterium]|nr:NF038104 family lipoprotein [Cellvibrionaceae bacterium]